MYPQKGGSEVGSYTQGFALCIYFHFWEPKVTWREIANDQGSQVCIGLTWCVLLIILRSKYKPKWAYFIPTDACCYFLSLRLLWRGSMTLTSRLNSGAHTTLQVSFAAWVVASNLCLWKSFIEILGWIKSYTVKAMGLPILFMANQGLGNKWLSGK